MNEISKLLTNERFKGLMFCQLFLPNKHRIILLYRWDSNDPTLSLHDTNHNVYRLDPSGSVVWQVRRDDSNRPDDWWEQLHALARSEGYDGAREPFMYIDLEYPDGRRITSDEQGDGKGILLWEPGCLIRLVGSAYQKYILDPETGIAKNVTPVPCHERPW